MNQVLRRYVYCIRIRFLEINGSPSMFMFSYFSPSKHMPQRWARLCIPPPPPPREKHINAFDVKYLFLCIFFLLILHEEIFCIFNMFIYVKFIIQFAYMVERISIKIKSIETLRLYFMQFSSIDFI